LETLKIYRNMTSEKVAEAGSEADCEYPLE